jgi:hypothetical protein
VASKIVDGGDDKEIIVRMIFPRAGMIGVVLFLFLWGSIARNFIGGMGEQVRHFSVETIFFSVFSLFWMLFGILGVLWFLWNAFGSQTLSRQGNDLIVTKKIGPIKNQRDKAFSIDKITNVRSEERIINLKGITGKEYTIVFDYSGQKQDLIHFLSEEQTETLLAGPLKNFLSVGK